MDILDPDVSYSEPTLQEKAILAIWIILWISLAGAGVIIICAMPASAAEINPSVDTIPLQCRYSFTKWLCDDKPGPVGAKGINGTPGTPGAGNFSAIYYNASNFTAYQNTTLIFGNITTGNNTINSNYTVIQGASFFNTTSINESYAYLPGRAGGQVLTGGTEANDDIYINATSSATKNSAYVVLQPSKGGNVGININNPANTVAIVNSTFDTTAEITIGQSQSGGLYTYLGWDGSRSKGFISTGNIAYPLILQSSNGNVGIGPLSTLIPTAQLHTTDTVRFAKFGAGTATFDAGGNISSVSDSKFKTSVVSYPSGLAQIKSLTPSCWKYTPESGLDTQNQYCGFLAQSVEAAGISGAVKTKDDVKYVQTVKSKNPISNEDIYETIEVKTGTTTKSLDDRAIIAALVNALKEEDAKVQALEARIAIIESKVK